jgi:hypothetical protein
MEEPTGKIPLMKVYGTDTKDIDDLNKNFGN